MKGSTKVTLITIVSVIALMLAVLFGVQGCQNSAIKKEKIVHEALDNIAACQTELFDALEEIGQTVQMSSEQESAFQHGIADLRTSSEGGINSANLAIRAVYENPPTWASAELYKEMTTAIQKYNANVKQRRVAYTRAKNDYEFYTEKFPNKSILNMLGYTPKIYEDLREDNSATLEKKTGKPKLFEEK